MTSQPQPRELTVKELQQRIDTGATPVILDVREPHELAIAQIPKTVRSLHIPLAQLPTRVDELRNYKEQDIIVYCRSGGRSQMAANFLAQNGYRAINLAGGILAWSKEIDPSIPQY